MSCPSEYYTNRIYSLSKIISTELKLSTISPPCPLCRDNMEYIFFRHSNLQTELQPGKVAYNKVDM